MSYQYRWFLYGTFCFVALSACKERIRDPSVPAQETGKRPEEGKKPGSPLPDTGKRNTDTLQVDALLFTQAVDMVNYEVSRFALKRSDTGLVHFDNAIGKGALSFAAISKAIPENFDKNLQLCNEINSIKKDSVTKNTRDAVIRFLLSDLFNDSTRFKASYHFYHSRLSKAVDSIDVMKMMTALQTNLSDTITAVAKRNEAKMKPGTTPKEDESNNLSWLWGLLFAAALAAWLIREYMHQQQIEKKKKEIGLLQENKKMLEKQLATEQQEQKKPVQAPVNQQPARTDAENITQPPVTTVPPANNQKTVPVKLYFPAPNRNGYFPVAAGGSTRRSTDAYLFELINDNEASFALMAEDPGVLESAISVPDSYVYPVNTIDANSTDWGKTKSISIEKKGVAKKEGDKWMVQSPAQIRLI